MHARLFSILVALSFAAQVNAAPAAKRPCPQPNTLAAAKDADHWQCALAQAEKGRVDYQTYVGTNLAFGGGVGGRKPLEGIAWLTRAAKAGDEEAKKLLGEIYLTVDDVRNYDLAYQWTYLASLDTRYAALAKKGAPLPAFVELAGHIDKARAEQLRKQAPRLLK